MGRFIGLDAGSVSVKFAILDEKGNILETRYVRHKGKPLSVAYELLLGLKPSVSLSITGSAGKLIAQVFGIDPVNEVIAQSYSTATIYPHVRTIIEMGGEDSKLILLENGKVKEFSMNSACAAGTGSFLDQQAERLRLTIEEFSEIALKSKSPPRIAGRCSVFAKSDMIHLQQIATPLKDIVAGLCFAVARNFKGSICKNMEIPKPVSFQGGVAANKGVVRAFKEVFRLEDIVIPTHFALMPAIGAALRNIKQGIENHYDIERLKDFISSQKSDEKGHKPLVEIQNSKFKIQGYRVHSSQVKVQSKETHNGQRIKAYLGIDIGSISTNLVVIDEEESLLAKRYLMTAGRPIEAVKQGLAEIGNEIGEKVQIMGVGTTGSGRYMIADFVGADIVKNEITAQARAAIEIDTDVDTIFEIGGQDSKYISIRNGIIVDFEMNKACAAGTGSFLEEQAEKLGISIKEEFASLAFKSSCPSCLGERCTVFMENSLLTKQQRGTPKENLIAGLAYSIVQNYINRVVGEKPIGEKIFFQGGVAFNKSVVSAFEKYLDKKIIVPPHHDVTGAIGMALIAKENRQSAIGNRQSSFKGFDLSKRDYEIKSFECKGCDNLCEINRVKIEGESEALFYGSRCERYDVKRREGSNKLNKNPLSETDLFTEREELLTKAHREYKEEFQIQDLKYRIQIGIPRIFFFHDFLPFWTTLLWELGFEVVLSERTNRQIINKGVEGILAESCFPHNVAHGHIKDLIDKNVEVIFVPSIINFHNHNDMVRSFACPYTQTIPYVANIAFRNHGIKILNTVVNFEAGEKHLIGELYRTLQPFHVSINKIKHAVSKANEAQKVFISTIKSKGREILEKISEKTIVIVGRSYNAFDPGINMEIPKKLSELGIFSIPMDYLPLEDIDITKRWHNMYWRSGQNILKAAEIIKDNPNLFAIYIGNFSCGPDSFIHRFFKETIKDKPFLQIEIDEHSADAGIITRCEAFLDSIEGIKKEHRAQNTEHRQSVPRLSSFVPRLQKRTVYIPRMSDHAFALASAFQSCSINAEVMDAPNNETIKIGRRYVSGKECYPCVITTGDMVKKILSKDFNPERSAFFMPSGTGPCRFGQYNIFHRLVLEKMGISDVPIFAPNQDSSFYKELGIVGGNFTRQAWQGIIATELLFKCLHETRPYEVNRGETESIYNKYLLKINGAVKSQNGDFNNIFHEIHNAFAMIPKTKEKKPLIGIIGEIFVRHNAFSNEDIVKKVEALGGKVWLAPIEEWLYYVNLMALRKALTKWKGNLFSRKHLNDITTIITTRFVQKKIEHKFSRTFKGSLKTLREPVTKEIFRNAAPYLHDSFEGEAILSIGKAVDFVKSGASGIINVMPFGCMPGTIVSALLKGLKQDTDIPCISFAYDGVETACSEIQLEAFMHQAKEYYMAKR